jgi:hypothetical protein
VATDCTLIGLIRNHQFDELWRYLESESHLPGPRANLELITVLVTTCHDHPTDAARMELERWLQTPVTDAPVNSAAEYPLACAAAALAAWLDQLPDQTNASLGAAAHDARWRTREAVTIGLQHIGRANPEPVLDLVQSWGTSGDPWLERAALVTLADAPLLKHPATAAMGLKLVDGILIRLQGLPQAQQKTEGNQVLAKGLSFTISMFVAALPEEGFARMEQWLMQADKNTRRILNENLGKARLTRRYSSEVARLKGIEFEINDWDRH